MLLAGLNYGNNLALLATFLMMGFVLVGMNLCHRNLQGLRILSATTPRVSPAPVASWS